MNQVIRQHAFLTYRLTIGVGPLLTYRLDDKFLKDSKEFVN